MYYTFITALAQIVLAQRFAVIHRLEYTYPLLRFQNLRSSEEE